MSNETDTATLELMAVTQRGNCPDDAPLTVATSAGATEASLHADLSDELRISAEWWTPSQTAAAHEALEASNLAAWAGTIAEAAASAVTHGQPSPFAYFRVTFAPAGDTANVVKAAIRETMEALADWQSMAEGPMVPGGSWTQRIREAAKLLGIPDNVPDIRRAPVTADAVGDAYTMGRNDYANGHDYESNPYGTEVAGVRDAWHRGWLDGKARREQAAQQQQ